MNAAALALALVASAASAPGPDATPATPSTDDIQRRLHALEQRVAEMEPPPEPPAERSAEPFAWGDFTWLNGGSRQTRRVLDTPYFTPQLDVDVNFSYSFHHPRDNTVVGSTALARNNELQLSFLGVGGDFHWKNVRARLWLQFGTRSTVVPRNDFSVLRGQFELATVYRYISEAYTGYHLDLLHGVNIDAGVFMSYVGLFSYMNFENWAYQPSFTSDNTPWFFNGVRIQVFPTDRLKVEMWIVNGWQTYGKFNNGPGLGMQVLYRPWEWVSILANNYVGTDTANRPWRIRYHSDNSILVRYFNAPGNLIHRAAVSFTYDFGFEHGDGVTALGTKGGPAQHFLSAMAYHRVWLFHGNVGWTFGGGFIHNPGRYLALLPTGAALARFDTSPGTTFNGWDASTTLDWMPLELITWRMELVHRESATPYFAGPGGVTSPDGYTTTSATDGWVPDQRRSENRFILAVLCRF